MRLRMRGGRFNSGRAATKVREKFEQAKDFYEFVTSNFGDEAEACETEKDPICKVLKDLSEAKKQGKTSGTTAGGTPIKLQCSFRYCTGNPMTVQQDGYWQFRAPYQSNAPHPKCWAGTP